MHTVEPVYYGHLGTNQRRLGVLIFQVSLCDKVAPFETITTVSVWIMQVSLFSSVRFHCICIFTNL